jgi:acyl-coenzyme A thioesterase PaaI-like protein
MAVDPVEPSDVTPDPRARVSFIAEMGFHCAREGDRMAGHSDPPSSALLAPGTDSVRPAVLLTLADVLIGSLANEAALPRITMTVDLNVRVLSPLTSETGFTGEARILKSGRTTTFGEATFAAAGSDTAAVLSHGTFIASPRPEDVGFSIANGLPRALRSTGMTVPLSARVGCVVVEPGVAEVARRDDLLNPADTLQGGLLALVAEEAACSLRPGTAPTELDVRYLSAVRVGPARASASVLGPVVRVEVRDAGNADRLAAVAVVRFAPDDQS